MRQLLFNAADVRRELYIVRNELRGMQNFHIAAWQKQPEGHHTPCACCSDYESRMRGIDRAIRHFGGRRRP